MSFLLSDTPQNTGLEQDQADLLYLLAYHHLQHGNPSQAALIFESAFSFDPVNAKVMQGLACAYLREGQPERALSMLEKIPQRHRGDALTWLLKGQAFTRTGRVAEAAGAMRMFIQKRALEGPQEASE